MHGTVQCGYFCRFSVALASNKNFLNNANGPDNHHAEFDMFLSYCSFIKILEVL